ncbi:hypothetical protein V1478_003408 [Vespula squamosa]|uniref:Uncharacterized protein n=1 Tax=Vespula squamosa TaxID=30214 RepID=A0ABD2BM35_VESSQ
MQMGSPVFPALFENCVAEPAFYIKQFNGVVEKNELCNNVATEGQRVTEKQWLKGFCNKVIPDYLYYWQSVYSSQKIQRKIFTMRVCFDITYSFSKRESQFM